jgi:hypothetical protein
MTRRSSEVNNANLRYKESAKDMEIWDRFIEQTGNVLNKSKMKFWRTIYTLLYSKLDGFRSSIMYHQIV